MNDFKWSEPWVTNERLMAFLCKKIYKIKHKIREFWQISTKSCMINHVSENKLLRKVAELDSARLITIEDKWRGLSLSNDSAGDSRQCSLQQYTKISAGIQNFCKHQKHRKICLKEFPSVKENIYVWNCRMYWR